MYSSTDSSAGRTSTSVKCLSSVWLRQGFFFSFIYLLLLRFLFLLPVNLQSVLNVTPTNRTLGLLGWKIEMLAKFWGNFNFFPPLDYLKTAIYKQCVNPALINQQASPHKHMVAANTHANSQITSHWAVLFFVIFYLRLPLHCAHGSLASTGSRPAANPQPTQSHQFCTSRAHPSQAAK